MGTLVVLAYDWPTERKPGGPGITREFPADGARVSAGEYLRAVRGGGVEGKYFFLSLYDAPLNTPSTSPFGYEGSLVRRRQTASVTDCSEQAVACRAIRRRRQNRRGRGRVHKRRKTWSRGASRSRGRERDVSSRVREESWRRSKTSWGLPALIVSAHLTPAAEPTC